MKEVNDVIEAGLKEDVIIESVTVGEVKEVQNGEIYEVDSLGLSEKLIEDKMSSYVEELTIKFSEPALIGVLSSNVMKYRTIGELEEDRAKITGVALSLARSLAEGILK